MSTTFNFEKKTFKTSRIYAIFFILLITRKQTTLTVISFHRKYICIYISLYYMLMSIFQSIIDILSCVIFCSFCVMFFFLSSCLLIPISKLCAFTGQSLCSFAFFWRFECGFWLYLAHKHTYTRTHTIQFPNESHPRSLLCAKVTTYFITLLTHFYLI